MDWQELIPERYRVTYNNGVFRILDTWHESIKNLNDINVDIPDNSPAMTLISTEQVNALMTKLGELGWLNKYAAEKQTILQQPKQDIKLAAIDNITAIVVQNVEDSTLAKEAISAIKSITEGK